MNDRARAIDILKRARDLLAERLTEKVLDSHEEILQDALGMSFESEIEAIHDKFGSRLSHLNSMISNLPEIKEAASAVEEEASAAGTLDQNQQRMLSAPSPVAGYLPSQQSVTFKAFAYQIQQGKLEAAGRALSQLFNVDAARGRDCAEVFHGKYRENPEVVIKAIRLRQELTSGNYHRSVSLLWECFGLQGVESAGVVQTLKTQLPSGS